MNSIDYIAEADNHLNNQDSYEKFTQDPSKPYKSELYALISNLDHSIQAEVKALVPKKKKQVYSILSPNYTNFPNKSQSCQPVSRDHYHKPTQNVRSDTNFARSIDSEHISGFINYIPKHLLPIIPCHINDKISYSFTKIDRMLNNLFLHSNMPHVEGIQVCRNFIHTNDF